VGGHGFLHCMNLGVRHICNLSQLMKTYIPGVYERGTVLTNTSRQYKQFLLPICTGKCHQCLFYHLRLSLMFVDLFSIVIWSWLKFKQFAFVTVGPYCDEQASVQLGSTVSVYISDLGVLFLAAWFLDLAR
jgi:hypothetical protein